MIQAILFVALLYLIPFGICAIFVHPYSRAFVVGIASARDPGHRLTLESPWYFFDPPWRKEIAVWRSRAVLCGGLMAVFHLFPFYTGLVSGWDSALNMTYVALGAFATFASASMLSIGFSFMLSPRLSSPGALSGASVLLGLIAHTLLHVFINFILNFALHSAALGWPRAFASVALGVIISCTLLVLVIRKIRRPGNESWFRLES